MIQPPDKDQLFITKLTDIILANLGNENFRVKELIQESGMSRHILVQKLHTIKNKSINQFIREIRLQKALEMLKNGKVTASEVAYKVGFSSPAYFNTCFNEYFGFTPGQVKKEDFFNNVESKPKPVEVTNDSRHKGHIWRTIILTSSSLLLLVLLSYLASKLFFKDIPGNARKLRNKPEISVAVLPFENLSDSSSNRYFIDGVMGEILSDLSKIQDLHVESRISVEQFRGSTKSASEIAKILHVNFIVEGSCQKYDNIFRLRVSITDAKNDKQIWAKLYQKELKEAKDIYITQSEIARSIASELKATVTPEEKHLIDKIPTTNLTAFDFCLRAKDANAKDIWPGFNQKAEKRAAALYRKALEYDSTYAEAYTGLAGIVWIRLDRDTTITDFNNFNKYLDSLLVLTNLALSYDDKLGEAYRLRGVYYYYKHSAKKAEEEYDKAIRINPNDLGAYWSRVFTYEDVDLVKTLENIQKIASLSHGSELLNVLKWMAGIYSAAGFYEKANDLCLEALKLDGDSVMYFKSIVDIVAVYLGDYQRAIEYYEKELMRDSTDAGVLDNLGEYYLRLGKYQESLKYYNKYISLLKSKGQTKPPAEAYIGYAYLQNGFVKEADFYFDKIIESLDNPYWRYRNTGGMEIWAEYTLAGIYACRGDKVKAYDHLRMFDQIQSVGLQWVTIINNDPLFNKIRNEPQFQKIVRNMKARFQAEHERVKNWLNEKGEL